jgi:putative SOS response-associated peptidase YedK
MCGRYTLSAPAEVVAELFELAEVPALERRYNIAPTQEAPVVRLARDGGRRLHLLRWGLVPYWADDPSIGSRMINCRAESAAEKPAYRDHFRRHRCLVVADGFYEWRAEAGGKQPYWIHRPDGEPFAYAGLWSRWDKAGEPLDTFTILTRDAHPEIAAIHPRMPVVVARDDWAAWLDPALTDREPLADLLRRSTGAGLVTRRVSRRVNSPAHDVPEVLREEPEEAPRPAPE